MAFGLRLIDDLIEELNIGLLVEKLLRANRDNQLESLQKLLQLVDPMESNTRSTTEKLFKSGIVMILVNILAFCDDEQIAEYITNILKELCSSKNANIESIHERIFYLKSISEKPTFGILCLLYAIAWSYKCRPKIINSHTLNYVVSSIDINELHVNNITAITLKMARAQTMLLSVLICLECTVNYDFIAEQMDDIIQILDAFLNINTGDNHQILMNALGCISLLKRSGHSIPVHFIQKMIEMLESNDTDTELLHRIVNVLLEFTRSNHDIPANPTKSNVELLMKCNIFKTISTVLCKCNSTLFGALCLLLENMMRCLDDISREYMVECIIKNNITQFMICRATKLNPSMPFLLLWILSMLDAGNEQHAYFFMICQNVMPYLCDINMYRKLLTDSIKPKIFMLQVFEKIVKIGHINKALNNDENICLSLINKYEGNKIIYNIQNDIVDNEKSNSNEKLSVMTKCLSLLHECNKNKNKNRNNEVEQSEGNKKLIVCCIVNRYNENKTNMFNIIPNTIKSMIWRFYFTPYEFGVKYLKFQLDINGNVIINRNKQCNHCKNIQINMQRCSACKYVFYCNSVCQRKDWNHYHKYICPKIKKFRVPSSCSS